MPRSAFRHAAFTVIWIATVVSNIGTWMYNAASGWLMVSLDPNPLVVSLVQVATSLPMFLFALPAGALADVFDKRRFLITLEGATTLVSAIFAALVGFGHVTPIVLLSFMFLIGVGGALTAPPGRRSFLSWCLPRTSCQQSRLTASASISVAPWVRLWPGRSSGW